MTNAPPCKAVLELHIFDFDGTLFNSPVPSKKQVQRLYPNHPRLYDDLVDPVWSGGLGWFQSLQTLSPPAVPEAPEVGKWFIQPVVRHFLELLRTRRTPAAAQEGVEEEGGGAAPAPTSPTALFFVLTGRDKKFQQRIESLLAHAGLLPHLTAVILKPHETYGTVKYKLETFAQLVERYQPSRVFYYEDRPEQGARLLEGVRKFQETLFCGGGGGNEDIEGIAVNAGRGSSSSGDGGHQEEVVERAAARLLSFTASDGLARQKLLSPSKLIHGSKAVGYTQRVAQRWVTSYLDERSKATGGGALRAAQRSTAAAGSSGGDGGVIYPFEFTMALLEPSLALQCESMLSDSALQVLVDGLYNEKGC